MYVRHEIFIFSASSLTVLRGPAMPTPYFIPVQRPVRCYISDYQYSCRILSHDVFLSGPPSGPLLFIFCVRTFRNTSKFNLHTCSNHSNAFTSYACENVGFSARVIQFLVVPFFRILQGHYITYRDKYFPYFSYTPRPLLYVPDQIHSLRFFFSACGKFAIVFFCRAPNFTRIDCCRSRTACV